VKLLSNHAPGAKAEATAGKGERIVFHVGPILTGLGSVGVFGIGRLRLVAAGSTLDDLIAGIHQLAGKRVEEEG
jgi:hypothetical protein